MTKWVVVLPRMRGQTLPASEITDCRLQIFHMRVIRGLFPGEGRSLFLSVEAERPFPEMFDKKRALIFWEWLFVSFEKNKVLIGGYL